MTRSPERRARPRAGHRCAFALLLAVAGAAAPVLQAQPSAELDDAVNYYEAAEFAQAIGLLVEIAERPETSEEVRKEALEYLGRAYIAERRYEDAKAAMERLLALEPPLIELDPDYEHPDLLQAYYEARREIEGGYTVERADPGLQTLAVMDFTNTSVDRHDELDPLRQGFASMMIHYLQGATDLKVIERERIQWLLDELEMQRDQGLVDPNSAVEAGRLLGAQTVLFGAFTAAGDRMWMSTRLVKVETGEILLAEQVFGAPDAFFELVEQLSLQIAQAISADLDQEDVGERRQTDSLDAMLAYSEGLALREQGDIAGAEAKFREALAYDPAYARAQRAIDGLHPFVAVAN